MAGVLAGRWVSYGLVTAGLLALLAPSAGAIEAIDGRVQAHGYVEMQIRAIDRDFKEELDLVQWYNIFNVELEFDIAPDGFGPIDLLEAFVRIEARYDCVYQQRGPCNIFPSVNTYGNDAKRLPKRLRDGIDPEYGGSIFLHEINPALPDKGPARFEEMPAFEDLFDNDGSDAFLEVRESDPLTGKPRFTEEQLQERLDAGDTLESLGDLMAFRGGVDDDPARYTFDPILDFRFAIKRMDGPGFGQNFLMGPWLPENFVEELAMLYDLANPFRGREAPVLKPGVGSPGDPMPRTRFFMGDPDPRIAGVDESLLGPLDPPFPLDPAYVQVPINQPSVDFNGKPYVDLVFEQDELGSAVVDGPYDIFKVYVVTGRIPSGASGWAVGQNRERAFYVYFPGGDAEAAALVGTTQWLGSDRDVISVEPVVPRYLRGDVVGFGGDYSGNIPFSPPSDPTREDLRGDEFRGGFGPFCSGPGLEDPIRCPNGREPDGRSVAVQNAIDGFATSTGLRPFSNSFLSGGLGELPLRPAPDRSYRDPSPNPRLLEAQGLYIPSPGLRRQLAFKDLDSHGVNLTESERAWNHGQSQDSKELKEAYFDLEMIDSRLWARLGLQTIIWGKTEVFPTTDQFNPFDMALANLPSLEEQRIALWAARFVYSLYEVGPLEDVRIEAAVNLDDFQPNDLGSCGEPYTLDVACQIPVGLLFHGGVGIGLAGVDRPPDPWDDIKGLEGGLRVEWRWDRFSFAVMDFYGFDDLPHPDPIFFYERNVDLATGRPVVTRFTGGTPGPQTRGGCTTPSSGSFDLVYDQGSLRMPIAGVDDGATTVALGFDSPVNPGSTSPRGIGTDEPCLKAGGAPGYQNENEFGAAQNALYNHYANQQLYAAICSATIATSDIDSRACALNLLNSPQVLQAGFAPFPMSEFAASLLSGEPAVNAFVRAGTRRVRADFDGTFSPLRALNRDRGPICDPATGAPFATPAECLASLEAGGWDGVITAKNNLINTPDQDAPSVVADPSTLSGSSNCRRTNNVACRRYSFHYDPLPVPAPGSQGDWLTLDSVLSNEQKALLGCGPLFGTRCDSADAVMLYDTSANEDPTPLIPAGGGVDLLNADASFLLQGWVGIEGTELSQLTPSILAAFETAEDGDVNGDGIIDPLQGERMGRVQLDELCQSGSTLAICKDQVFPEGEGGNRYGTPLEPTWLTTATSLIQPGTIRLSDGATLDTAQPCTVFDETTGTLEVLPGCHGIEKIDAVDNQGDGIPDRFEVTFQEGYIPSVDGCVFGGDETGFMIGGVPVTAMAHDGGPVEGLDWCRKQFVGDDGDPLTDDGYTFLYGSNSRFADPINPENRGFPITGAQALFHPLAGCLTDVEATSLDPRVTGTGGSIAGNVCRFWKRDFASELAGLGLDLDGNPTGRGPENVFLFRSEGAALSFNAQMFLAWSSCNGDVEEEVLEDPECFDPADAFSPQRCSFAAPQYCDNVKGMLASGLQRNTVRAGGTNGRGRRVFIWHSGGEAVLRYDRRNVLGFSMDFTEDITKTNWGVEFTWMNEATVSDADSPTSIRDVQLYNLTVSVDRPTFINFLNPNRTFFMNTQWFFQYVSGYRDSFAMNGPLNVLFTFAVFTGYYQDRLLPNFVAVYDFNSKSGAFLPKIAYRFTEALSAEVGVSLFIGRTQLKDMPLRGFGPAGNRQGKDQYKDGVDNLLSHFRHRDEVWLRLRWTF